MKKLILAFTMLAGVQVYAQKGTPDAVKTAFAKAYPGAQNVKWDKEDNDYEVSFKQGSKSMSAIYDMKGTLKETETSIVASELPAAVMPYFKEHYKGAVVKETAKITKANGEVNYEVGIKGKDVLFDAKGKFLKEAKD